jgi:hypothetical protein
MQTDLRKIKNPSAASLKKKKKEKEKSKYYFLKHDTIWQKH